jgi:hypothetical protein
MEQKDVVLEKQPGLGIVRKCLLEMWALVVLNFCITRWS